MIQSIPVALTHALSIAGSPLEKKLFPQILLFPVTRLGGGAGNGPLMWLLLTSTNRNSVCALIFGIGPVSALLAAHKYCSTSPSTGGIGPESWLFET